MLHPISREEFEALLQKIVRSCKESEETVRAIMMTKLQEAELFIQESPQITLIEQISHNQMEAGEQVVIAHLEQFEQGLKNEEPSFVKQVHCRQILAGEDTVVAYLKERGL